MHTCLSLVVFLAPIALARLGEPALDAANETDTLPLLFPASPTEIPDDQDELKRLEAEMQELEKTNGTIEGHSLSFSQADVSLASLGGYAHFATTTRYGDAAKSACGALSTSQLVKGTRWFNVASSQSMQGGSCCYCQGGRGGGGTVGMGCLSCARGRFLRSSHGFSNFHSETGHGAYASGEIFAIVADICPANSEWCPGKPGQKNHYGSYNHLDFSRPPAGIDNNNFVFTPMTCPAEISARYHRLSKCNR